MRKRLSILLTVATLLTCSLAGCGLAKDVSEEKSYEKVTIRIATRPTDLAKYDLEEALGFWEEEFAADGITVEAVKVTNGSDFVDSITTGSVDMGIFGDQPIIAGIANGKSLKIIGRNSSDAQGYKLVVNEDSTVESVADLKGKNIAVKAGGASQKIWLRILAEYGMTINDVNAVNLNPSDALTALKKGEVEAMIGYEGDGIDFSTEGKVLLSYSEIADCVHLIAASNDFAEKYPELVARVLKVYQKTGEWITNNKDEAIAQFQEIGGLDLEGATALYNSETWSVQWDKADEEAIDDTATWLYDSDILKNKVKASEIVDTTYLRLAGLYVGEDIDY